ncbi:Proteophosphoglycan ppg4 [Rhodotorula toruloides ATCC 204091]|uniref:Proteophosphoglycan ppg4 n=1 Tax=Rhodotorula toruloides TaxID=5286 RepID=A0A0K3CR01_RHOTO|nr:Proteophosphoglycan ppg4 [Rhodotorula toruloides ATCC 204091]KAK4331033.1 Proteophosphoglycan ppg4 [Rhodotorula toruloides]PRQ70343.1 Proteophosphoglycan ppg4 [Rhodotorula toruloides]
MLRTLCAHLAPRRPLLTPSSTTTRLISSSSPAPAPVQAAAARARPSAPKNRGKGKAAAAPAAPAPSHYLITLLRSPNHLGVTVNATTRVLGLRRRLSSVIVPINAVNAGYILRIKELVGVRLVSREDVQRWASKEWRERPGEGNQGSGLRIVGGSGPNAVIRVGSERARGDERGFKVVGRASPL